MSPALNWLIGTWEVVGTTANLVLPDATHHHFDREGRHVVEVAFGPGASNPYFLAGYRAEPDGYWTSFDPSKRPPVAQWFTRFVPCAPSYDEIVVTGASGDGWWIRRLTQPVPYLDFFVDPQTGKLSRRR